MSGSQPPRKNADLKLCDSGPSLLPERFLSLQFTNLTCIYLQSSLRKNHHIQSRHIHNCCASMGIPCAMFVWKLLGSVLQQTFWLVAAGKAEVSRPKLMAALGDDGAPLCKITRSWTCRLQQSLLMSLIVPVVFLLRHVEMPFMCNSKVLIIATFRRVITLCNFLVWVK